MSTTHLGDLHEKVDDILNKIESRLETDSRRPGTDAAFPISYIEVRRSERFNNPDHYPIVYILDGDVSEDELTPIKNAYKMTVWLQIFDKDRDSEEGTRRIRALTLGVRRLFRETKNDKLLVAGSPAAATVRHVATPTYSWGAFQPIANSDEIEFAGLVQLDIEFDLVA